MRRILLISYFILHISYFNASPVRAQDLNNDGWVDLQDIQSLLLNFSQFTVFTFNQIVYSFGQNIAPPPPTGGPSPTPDPTILTFVDGYGGNVDTGIDTQMSASWANRNGGTHPHTEFGRDQRLLMKFDLSSIPTSAQIIDATLTLYHGYWDEGSRTSMVYIYSIASGNANWIEGTKNIEIAALNEPTWDARQADGNGGVLTPWAGSPGLSTQSYNNTNGNFDFIGRHEPVNAGNLDGPWYTEGYIGSFIHRSGVLSPEEDPYTISYVVNLDPAVVQTWFGPNNQNYGIIFRSIRNLGHAATAEYSHPTLGSTLRPKLVIRYTL